MRTLPRRAAGSALLLFACLRQYELHRQAVESDVMLHRGIGGLNVSLHPCLASRNDECISRDFGCRPGRFMVMAFKGDGTSIYTVQVL